MLSCVVCLVRYARSAATLCAELGGCLSSGYEGTELVNLLKVENCPHRIDNISQGTCLTLVLDDWPIFFFRKDGGLLTVFIAVVATTAKLVFSFCGTHICDVKALEWVKPLFERRNPVGRQARHQAGFRA